jgi:hypothetical protein
MMLPHEGNRSVNLSLDTERGTADHLLDRPLESLDGIME